MSKNNLKFSVSSIIIILSLILGAIARAEDTTTTETQKPVREKVGEIRKEINSEFKNKITEIKGGAEAKKEGVKKEFETQKDLIKKELEVKKEEAKTKIEGLVGDVKTAREEYKKEIEAKREEVKAKIAEMKTSFTESLTKVKDENKKISAEKIISAIQELNTKLTTQLSTKIDQIENVLVSIESRISKAEAKGLDVTTAKTQVLAAKEAISKARAAISIQSQKVYTTTITSETTLKTEIKAVRDTFKKEMASTSELVKASHIAVKTTAETLAKIPGVDNDQTETSTTTTN